MAWRHSKAEVFNSKALKNFSIIVIYIMII
jgi:hypothetical protein